MRSGSRKSVRPWSLETRLRRWKESHHMLAEERRAEILRLIQNEGRVHVKELSHRFRTSEVTIRQDLRGLKARGLIRRAHGGALAIPEVAAEAPLLERAQMRAAEKGRVAAAAAELIAA